MRLTALLPPPPTPITSILADWLGTMPPLPLLLAALRPSGAISMEGPNPFILASIMSAVGLAQPCRMTLICVDPLTPQRRVLVCRRLPALPWAL